MRGIGDFITGLADVLGGKSIEQAMVERKRNKEGYKAMYEVQDLSSVTREQYVLTKRKLKFDGDVLDTGRWYVENEKGHGVDFKAVENGHEISGRFFIREEKDGHKYVAYDQPATLIIDGKELSETAAREYAETRKELFERYQEMRTWDMGAQAESRRRTSKGYHAEMEKKRARLRQEEEEQKAMAELTIALSKSPDQEQPQA